MIIMSNQVAVFIAELEIEPKQTAVSLILLHT